MNRFILLKTMTALQFITPLLVAVGPSSCQCLETHATGAESDTNVLAEFPIDGFNGIATAPVSFNGIEYSFGIDTGSTTTNFVPELSSLLHATGRRDRFYGVDRAADLSLYSSPEGAIAGLKVPALDNVSCYEENLNRLIPSKVYGQLGMDALRSFIIQFDYGRNRILFLRAVPRNAGVRVPFIESLVCPSIKAELAGRECAFLIDTGCVLFGAGGIRGHDFRTLVARDALSVTERLPNWSAFGGSENRAGILKIPLSVAGHQHTGLAVLESTNSETADNTLGAGYLRRYVVTFDFPSRAVYFAAGPDFSQIDVSHDPGGFRLRRDGNRLTVCRVAWHCPASEAGVRIGDVLVQIDNRSAAGLTDIAVARLLSQCDRPVSMVFHCASDGTNIRFVHDERALRERALEQFNAHPLPTRAGQTPPAGRRMFPKGKWWHRSR